MRCDFLAFKYSQFPVIPMVNSGTVMLLIEDTGARRQKGGRLGEVHPTTTGAGSACSAVC